jgi:hypothetical protein
VVNRPALLTITHGDDMSWNYVFVKDFQAKPQPHVKLTLHGVALQQIQSADVVAIEWHEGEQFHHYTLQLVAQSDSLWVFNCIGETHLSKKSRSITVNYNDTIRLQTIEPSELSIYQNKAMQGNLEEKDSVSRNIKAAMLNEDSEIRTVLSFMVDLNNKLDMILDILHKKDDDERVDTFDNFRVNCMGINSDEIIFQSGRDIPSDTFAYIRNTLGRGDERFTFAAVVRISPIVKSKSGWFYKATYEGMPEAVQDSVIKYVFAKEKNMIKQIKG